MTTRRRLLKTALLLAALGALASLAKVVAPAIEPASRRTPVLFIGLGSPVNAIEDNAFSRFLRDRNTRLPRPKAILVVSAHWLTPASLPSTSRRARERFTISAAFRRRLSTCGTRRRARPSSPVRRYRWCAGRFRIGERAGGQRL